MSISPPALCTYTFASGVRLRSCSSIIDASNTNNLQLCTLHLPVGEDGVNGTVLRCPYDKQHITASLRYFSHLKKCPSKRGDDVEVSIDAALKKARDEKIRQGGRTTRSEGKEEDEGDMKEKGKDKEEVGEEEDDNGEEHEETKGQRGEDDEAGEDSHTTMLPAGRSLLEGLSFDEFCEMRYKVVAALRASGATNTPAAACSASSHSDMSSKALAREFCLAFDAASTFEIVHPLSIPSSVQFARKDIPPPNKHYLQESSICGHLSRIGVLGRTCSVDHPSVFCTSASASASASCAPTVRAGDRVFLEFGAGAAKLSKHIQQVAIQSTAAHASSASSLNPQLLPPTPVLASPSSFPSTSSSPAISSSPSPAFVLIDRMHFRHRADKAMRKVLHAQWAQTWATRGHRDRIIIGGSDALSVSKELLSTGPGSSSTGRTDEESKLAEIAEKKRIKATKKAQAKKRWEELHAASSPHSFMMQQKDAAPESAPIPAPPRLFPPPPCVFVASVSALAVSAAQALASQPPQPHQPPQPPQPQSGPCRPPALPPLPAFPFVERVQADIAHIRLRDLPGLRQGQGQEGRRRGGKALVGCVLSKHLCGPATDLTLQCILRRDDDPRRGSAEEHKEEAAAKMKGKDDGFQGEQKDLPIVSDAAPVPKHMLRQLHTQRVRLLQQKHKEAREEKERKKQKREVARAMAGADACWLAGAPQGAPADAESEWPPNTAGMKGHDADPTYVVPWRGRAPEDGEGRSTPLDIDCVCIATCCHALCTWSSFCNQAFLLRHGLSPADFAVICAMSSWATLRRPTGGNLNGSEGGYLMEQQGEQGEQKEASFERRFADLYTDRLVMGQLCKLLLDWARMEALRCDPAFTRIERVVYTTRSPESSLLLAWRN